MKTAVEVHCDELAVAVCKREVECGFVSSLASCVARRTAPGGASSYERCLGTLPYRKEFTFNREAGQKCLSQIPAATCSEVSIFDSFYSPVCFNLGTPYLAQGQECFDSTQCIGENYCPFIIGPVCPNTCTPRLAIGQTLTAEYQECVTTAYLDTSLICRARAGVGEACGPAKRGNACKGNASCQQGKCVARPVGADRTPVGGACMVDPKTMADNCVAGSNCKDSKCTARGDVGASCADRYDCKYDLLCTNSKCVARGAVGQACDTDSCDTGLFCVNAKCSARGAVGDACTASSCGGGLFCINAKCSAKGAEGDACQGFSCASGLTCLGNKCVQRLDVGATCTDGYNCKNGLFCFEGKCAAPAGVGAACREKDINCEKGLFCDENSKCAAPRAEGQPCQKSYPDQCQSNLLCARPLAAGGQAGPLTCLKPQPQGASCAPYGDACDKSTYCKSSVCVPRLTAGNACRYSDKSCQQGLDCDLYTNMCRVEGVCK
jgi:hypothetical protein